MDFNRQLESVKRVIRKSENQKKNTINKIENSINELGAHQTQLKFTVSQSLLKLMSIELVMPSTHLILCHPLLLLPSIFPSTFFSPVSQLFASSGQSIGGSASASVLPMAAHSVETVFQVFNFSPFPVLMTLEWHSSDAGQWPRLPPAGGQQRTHLEPPYADNRSVLRFQACIQCHALFEA